MQLHVDMQVQRQESWFFRSVQSFSYIFACTRTLAQGEFCTGSSLTGLSNINPYINCTKGGKISLY